MGWPSFYENLIEKLVDASNALSRDLDKLHDAPDDGQRQESIKRATEAIKCILHEVLDLATNPDVNLASHCKSLQAQADKQLAALNLVAAELKTSPNEEAVLREIRELHRKIKGDDSEIADIKNENQRLEKIIRDMHEDRFLMLSEFQRVDHASNRKKFR